MDFALPSIMDGMTITCKTISGDKHKKKKSKPYSKQIKLCKNQKVEFYIST